MEIDDKKECQEVIKKIEEYFNQDSNKELDYSKYCFFWEEIKQ